MLAVLKFGVCGCRPKISDEDISLDAEDIDLRLEAKF